MNTRQQKTEPNSSQSNALLPLEDGPVLPGHVVKHNDTAAIVIIDNTLILCTKTEYGLLMKMLEQPGEVVLFEDFVHSFDYQRDRRPLLMKHMTRLRHKLPPYLRIKCVVDEGYLLRYSAPEPEKDEENGLHADKTG